MKSTIFMASARCEWRALRRDPALWLVLGLLIALVLYAVHAGRVNVVQQRALIAGVQADEAQRLASLRARIAEVEAGRLVPPSPYTDPRNAMWVGAVHAATQAVLPPAALGAVAVGQSDLQPPNFKVSALSKESFLFADEIRNPLHLLAGSVDLAFVIVWVLPLALLALTYNLVSAERERGTLALMASFPVDLRRVLSAKLAVRAGAPVLALLLAMSAALAAASGPAALASPDFGLLVLAVVLYGAMWAGIAAWVNGRGHDSAWNALAVAGAWIGLVLVVPAAVNGLAELLRPVPSRAEMVLAVRAASVSADREQDASIARYNAEHPDATTADGTRDRTKTRGSVNERLARRLAVIEAGDARAEQVLARHEQQLDARQRVVDGLMLVSPTLLMHEAVGDLAGNGSRRFAAFRAQVDKFHARWREHFLSRTRVGGALTSADYAAFPRFDFVEREHLASPARHLALIALMVLVAALASAGAWRHIRP